MIRVGDILSHPLVLRAAWMRVDAWYRSGNLAPQPELARWRLHPEAELRELGSDLQAGRWIPVSWRQIPYPKKGSRLRHYVFPTVRDQVAFMAYMVLLGPLLDSRIASFAFGNRWYRPIAWDRRRTPAQWVHRPYPLLTPKSYLPYARSHGLFRRVAHWTVARMTGASVCREDYGGRVQHPDDYSDGSLPPWIRTDWWAADKTTDQRACWAALDVQLAYPSVRLDRLRASLIAMLTATESDDLNELFGGYPRSVVLALGDQDVRKHLARRLVDALEQVRVEDGQIPRDAWCPPHAAPRLPPDKDLGLPTGLAISGMLLNVALYFTDETVLRYLKKAGTRGAIVRFADDMVILSRSVRGVLDLLEAVWRGLADDDHARLDVLDAKSNLFLNFAKIGPPPVRDVVFAFLRDQGWEESCDYCEQLLPPDTPKRPHAFGTWWDAHQTDDGFEKLRVALARATVGPGELGPFVTSLVARLSEIGRDTLTDRFGEGARERLVRLHELARFDIDDQQVRADTRRTFAVNRLVRAWLPPDGERAGSALEDIRSSVAYVLGKTPWKFALWRAVVRAAARRPEHRDRDEADQEARTWLANQLRRIAHEPPEMAGPTSWLRTWPEDDQAEDHGRDPMWRALYLSFHRTAFWHALAEVLRELWRHHDRVERPHPGDAGPPPRWWTVRAVPAGLHEHVARFLGATDQWVDVLYPQKHPDLSNWPWELEQLIEAVLASGPRFDLATAWRRSERPGDMLVVPATVQWLPRVPRTASLLARFGRVCPPRDRARPLNTSALAHVRLGGRDHRLGELLFPADRSPRILGVRKGAAHAVAIGVSLGCGASIGYDLVAELVPEPGVVARTVAQDPLALWEYGRARRVLLGHERHDASQDEEPQ